MKGHGGSWWSDGGLGSGLSYQNLLALTTGIMSQPRDGDPRLIADDYGPCPVKDQHFPATDLAIVAKTATNFRQMSHFLLNLAIIGVQIPAWQ